MFDLYQHVTDRIVAALEQGAPPGCGPGAAAQRVAHQPQHAQGLSRREFHAALLEAAVHGYAVNQWLTYRQALQLRAHVRRANRAHRGVLAAPGRRVRRPRPEPPGRRRPMLRAYTVFNVDQIDGLAAAPPSARPTGRRDTTPRRSCRPPVRRSAMRGRRPTTPPRRTPYSCRPSHVPCPAGYYATALHELVHWTGHDPRCDRQLRNRFGDDAYAVEELIAELGAAFLCAHCRIDGELQHASYVASWLQGPPERQAGDLHRRGPGPAGGGLRARLAGFTGARHWRPDPAPASPGLLTSGDPHGQLLRTPQPDQRLRTHREEGCVRLPFLALRGRAASARRSRRASWEVRRFDGLPYLKTDLGYFVEVAVTVQGVTLSPDPPGARCRTGRSPSPRASTSTPIQRCLVKAIALHGLGLYIYAGEDLPDEREASHGARPKPRCAPDHADPVRQRVISRTDAIHRAPDHETGGDRSKLLDYFGVEQLAELTSPCSSRASSALDENRGERHERDPQTCPRQSRVACTIVSSIATHQRDASSHWASRPG